MNHLRIYSLGAAAAAGVLALWIIWAFFEPNTEWKKYDALGVLISGLAFVGLVITVAIQLADIKEQEKSAVALQNERRQFTAVNALSSVRVFAGSRISHLQERIRDGTVHETDQITPEQATTEIKELRELIRSLEMELQEICGKLVPGTAAWGKSRRSTPPTAAN